ncbi:MAG TPA: tetraacyldisaccharide 4'-kinase [Stellaceae bacterium]|nr:tetraacyldisaccharide 4'-kinase [Stellaceae bacterium]
MPPPPTPEFWAHRGLLSTVLAPAAWVYGMAGAARQRWTAPWRAPVPVVCVGNLVAGGAGKTPVSLSLARRLRERRWRVHILSRGYGGRSPGPLAVDPARHTADEVGDEPLLLAEVAPCWVAPDRVAGAKAAIAAGAELLLLDDGFQNPTLAKDLSLVVIDGAYGLGNGRVLPAGPLREPLARGLARADAIVLMGDDAAGVAALTASKPLCRARLVPENPGDVAGRTVVALAGIGRPEKFFTTLEEAGARIFRTYAFPDHHRYREDELARPLAEAEGAGAMLITTTKDWVRLPPALRPQIRALSVSVVWDDLAALDALLDRVHLPRRQRGQGGGVADEAETP